LRRKATDLFVSHSKEIKNLKELMKLSEKHESIEQLFLSREFFFFSVEEAAEQQSPSSDADQIIRWIIRHFDAHE
jgi:hypothetical protein